MKIWINRAVILNLCVAHVLMYKNSYMYSQDNKKTWLVNLPEMEGKKIMFFMLQDKINLFCV